MTEHISLRTRLRNHTVTQREQEVPEKDRAVEEILPKEEEEEEEEEEYNAMPVER